eukprot:252120-Amphidinium_carterae.2
MKAPPILHTPASCPRLDARAHTTSHNQKFAKKAEFVDRVTAQLSSNLAAPLLLLVAADAAGGASSHAAGLFLGEVDNAT